jgi:Domain of unknown function (DUF2382)
VPIVSEVLHVEKRWVVTEEIHLTQIEQRETVQQAVRVNHERAEVERFDQGGNVVSTVDPETTPHSVAARNAPESLVGRRDTRGATEASGRKRKVLSRSQGMLKNRPDDVKKTS